MAISSAPKARKVFVCHLRAEQPTVHCNQIEHLPHGKSTLLVGHFSRADLGLILSSVLC